MRGKRLKGEMPGKTMKKLLGAVIVLTMLCAFVSLNSLSVHAMRIVISISDGSGTSDLDVEPSDTIESVKNKIEERQSIPFADQTLKFGTTELEDNRTLGDYNIPRDSTLSLIVSAGTPVCKNTATNVEYNSLSEAFGAVQNGETILLLADIELDRQVTLTGEKSVTLDGAEHTIAGGGARNGLRVENGASLTMTDVVYDGQNKLYNNGSSSGGFIEISNGHLILADGAVVRNADLPSTYGVHSIIFLANSASMTMKAGSSISNVFGHMSVVRLNSGSVFTMDGGTIDDCHTKDAYISEGVVFYLGDGKNGDYDTDHPATFIMNGGTISNCSPQSSGSTPQASGVIYMHPSCCAKVVLNGGEIKSCAASYGGAVYSMPGRGVTHTVNISGTFIATSNEGFEIDSADEHAKSNMYLGNSGIITITGELTGNGMLGVWTLTEPADAANGDVQIAKYGAAYAGNYTDAAHVVSDKPTTASIVFCDGTEDYYSDGTLTVSHHTCSASTRGLWLTTNVMYTISYELNGGTVETANPTAYNTETETITLNNPSKPNYIFSGWTGSNGTEAEASVSIAQGSAGNREYTANWIAKTAQTITAEDVTAAADDTGRAVSAATDGDGTLSYAVKSGEAADVVSVNASTGALTILKEGSTVVTVSASETAACASAEKDVSITVTPAVLHVSGVSLNKTTASLKTGETVTLTATVVPEDAADRSVTWASSDQNVATVSDGLVTAVAAGTATITVTTTDGNYTAECSVTVEEAVPEAPVHTHSYEEAWSGDAEKHWHACTGTVGTCDAPESDSASHSGGEATCRDKAKCSVCGAEYGEVSDTHQWGEWNAETGTRSCTTAGCTEKDSCSHEGKVSGTCKVCGKTLEAPKTGDSGNALLWMLLMAAALSVCGASVLITMKHRR